MLSGVSLQTQVEKHDNIQIINRLLRFACTTKIAGPLQLERSRVRSEKNKLSIGSEGYQRLC